MVGGWELPPREPVQRVEGYGAHCARAVGWHLTNLEAEVWAFLGVAAAGPGDDLPFGGHVALGDVDGGEVEIECPVSRPVIEDHELTEGAELVRRLQEYERFKKAAQDISDLPRLERDTFVVNADAPERKIVTQLPDVTLKELLIAFHDVLKRAEMFSNLHLQREPLSVRQRMSEILSRIDANAFTGFAELFDPEEGRMGVAVTFIAILELLRETVIEVVQAEEFSPLHVRAAASVRLVGDADGAVVEDNLI